MFRKLRDFLDTQVSMVILIDTVDDFCVLANVIVRIGRDRCTYAAYKDQISAYMMELRMPYNRYLALMKNLRRRGYNLRPESNADVINRLFKM